MKKILFIIGSLRKNSFNRELANEAKQIIGDRAEVSILEYQNIPFMNQDLEKNTPEEIKRVRKEVQEADAIWIFTPEYNGWLPGVLKNLLDWLSRPLVPGNYASGTAIKGKPVIFSGAGGKRATSGSRAQLKTLLGSMMTKVCEPDYGFAVPPKEMASDHWILTEEDKKRLSEQADAFLKEIGAE